MWCRDRKANSLKNIIITGFIFDTNEEPLCGPRATDQLNWQPLENITKYFKTTILNSPHQFLI